MPELEVIGDAGAGSGTRTAVTLQWGSDGSAPSPTTLPAAPPGLYSKLSLHVDGSLVGDSYTITGTVSVLGVDTPYLVHDDAELSISVPITGTLDPGTTLVVPIEIDLARAVMSLDFSNSDFDGGALTIDQNNSQIDSFRTSLRDAFELSGSGSGSGVN